MADTAPERRILRSMRIMELSAVDTPAQEGARFILAKRQDKDGDLNYVAPTGAGDYVCGDCGAHASAGGKCAKCGGPMKAVKEGDINYRAPDKRDFSTQQREHAAHSGAAMPDGSFPIENGQDLHNAITAWGRAKPGDRGAVARHIRRRAEALGLTDSLPTEGELASAMGRGKSANEDWYADFTEGHDMTDAEKLAQAETDLAAEKAKNEVLAKMAGMSDAEKEHFAALKELDAEGADSFLAQTPEERAVEIEKAKTADPVVYTDSEGHEYHKSEARAASLAKRADETDKENKALKAASVEASFEKRAAEFPHLKGETAVKVAVLKAIEGITDEAMRAAATEMLKANDAGLADAMKTLGSMAGPVPSEPEAKLNKMAEDKAEAEGISYVKAYDLVAQSPEGKALYKEMIEAKEKRAA